MRLLTFLISFFILHACTPEKTEPDVNVIESVSDNSLQVGAAQFSRYFPLLHGKTVGLVVNQSSLVNGKHLIDTLLERGIRIRRIFAPEHGLEGIIDRGKTVTDSVNDLKGIEIVSIYGKNKKPTDEQLRDLDVLIFDIQDVGVRFFTYISSMHYVMEACAENDKPLIVLDRPNPLGDYVAGAVLEPEYQSFVGMHPIPIVHGLTVGELAKMINGEGWLANKNHCILTVIPVKNYDHKTSYSLPVKPSPNLPNDLAIRLYPSLCFFEASRISIGRGTDFPFQVMGYPNENFGDFTFTPRDISGVQTNPLHEGKTCYGIDLRQEDPQSRFTLSYFLKFRELAKEIRELGGELISNKRWFDLLAGNSSLRLQIEKGFSEKEILQSWENDLEDYKKMRKQYLLYPDFE